jgi:hypothetical protein
VAKVAHERTVKIIPESQSFRERHILIWDWRREIIFSASTTLAKQNARHALEICDRTTHRTRDRTDGLEAGIRT